jgi:hypothetical protein
MPDVIATRNLTFDKEGYLRLSKPTISFYTSNDDADFGTPIFIADVNVGIYYVLTDEAQFELDMLNFGVSSGGYMNCVETTATGAPKNSSSWKTSPGACWFNREIAYTTNTRLYTHPGGSFSNSWTDRGTLGGIGSNLHPLVEFSSTSNLAVGDDNTVAQVNTAFAASTKLTIPGTYVVNGIAYNNGFVGITTHDAGNNGNGRFFVWDGRTTAANYSYDIGASTCTSPVAYRGSFVFLNGDGRLLYWTPQGLETFAELPGYFNGSHFFTGNSNVNKDTSVAVDGDIIYINIDSTFTSYNSDNEIFIPEQPGGIWCYDPAVGLYHRHAPTATKAIVDVIPTTDVDTTNDTITVTTAYPTGTPVRYASSNGTVIGGLVKDQVYYTIYVDATTVKLASTYANALANTAVDITGTGNQYQTLQFYPKPDFGQVYFGNQQGVVQYLERTSAFNGGVYIGGVFYGSRCSQRAADAPVEVGGFVLNGTENRGHFITSKFQSQNLQDDWQKLYIKHSKLVNDLDKIVVKYRTSGNDRSIVKVTPSSGTITWSDSDTFTTTDTQWANVQAGDEVEIVQGAGAGYLLHIDSISVNSGTYTVNLTEGVKNISASDTGRAVVSRWTLLGTLDTTTPQNNDGYSELTICQRSKSIQFKIELRGEDVEVEELLIAHQPIKLAI